MYSKANFKTFCFKMPFFMDVSQSSFKTQGAATPRHFGSYKESKLGGKRCQGRYSPVNLVGHDSTKSVYNTISSLLQNTVTPPSLNN